MRRGLLLVGGIAVGAALFEAARRKRARSTAPPTQSPAVGDPADELRQTLRTAREAEVATTAAGLSPSLEERRARVHEKAQEALELMRDQDRVS
jgi:hypothetical protein